MPCRFLHRHQPKPPHAAWIKGGLGGGLGIAAVGLLGDMVGLPLLVAPLGASAVLVFALPESPLAQPANVIGGHLVAAAIGLALLLILPPAAWAMGVAVGVAIAAMVALRLTHPPAGANPLVIFLAAAALPPPGPQSPESMALAEVARLAAAVLPAVGVGGLLLVVTGALVHRLPPRITPYPLPPRSG